MRIILILLLVQVLGCQNNSDDDVNRVVENCDDLYYVARGVGHEVECV